MQPSRANETLKTGSKVCFADEAASALLSGSVEELCHPEGHSWEQVKHNVSRTVYRGRIGDQDIYVKHFHGQSAVHRLARRLGVSRARYEMSCSQYLRAHGVETAPALATMCHDDVEWYATLAVAPAEQASLWHVRQLARGPAGQRAIHQAVIALAETIGRMHEAGVIHCDLHAGNILVQTGGEPPRLVLTDLHRVKRRRHLTRRSRAANLAQLYHDRFDFTTRTQRLLFLKHYLRVTGAPGTLRGWQLMIEDFARRHTRRLYAQQDRRTTGDNRYFARISLGGGWRCYVVLASRHQMVGSTAVQLEFTPDAWQEALRRPESLLEKEGAEVVKESSSSLVLRRRLTVGEHTVDVFIKQRRRKFAWKIVLDCFRDARAIRAFKLGHVLLARRIATALPLAAMERRVGPFLTHSILITEAVDAPNMNQFLNTWLAEPPRGQATLNVGEKRQLAREVLRELGRLLQRLHDKNLAHRDLKNSNLLIRWEGDAAPEAVLVDLDGLSRRRWLSTRRRFQGLMRLNVSLLECAAVNHAGRLRMLLGYLRRPGSGRINFKPYWRVLERWSAKKLRQQIRSRRNRQKAARRPSP